MTECTSFSISYLPLNKSFFSKSIQRCSNHVQDSSCSGEPIQVKELLIMTFEKIGFFFFFYKAFLCGIADVAQPHPDSASSGPQVN